MKMYARNLIVLAFFALYITEIQTQIFYGPPVFGPAPFAQPIYYNGYAPYGGYYGPPGTMDTDAPPGSYWSTYDIDPPSGTGARYPPSYYSTYDIDPPSGTGATYPPNYYSTYDIDPPSGTSAMYPPSYYSTYDIDPPSGTASSFDRPDTPSGSPSGASADPP